MSKENSFGLLQVRYCRESIAGQVIEHLKTHESNISRIVRDYIVYHRSYEYFKTKQISQLELQVICLNNYQFLASQYEISKLNLKQENADYFLESVKNINKASDVESQQLQEVQASNKQIISGSPTRDKSFIKSLLPK